MHDTFVCGPRQILCRNRETFGQRKNELRICDFISPTRDIWLGNKKLHFDLEDKNHVDKITVLVESDFAGGPVSRKSTTGLVAQIGNHTVKSRSTLQILTALVRGGQVGLALRSKNQDLGIPMKVEIQSDSSMANSLTDRLGAGQRTEHVDTRYLWVQERVQDGDLSIKKMLTARNGADVGRKPVSASVLQQHCKFAGFVFY